MRTALGTAALAACENVQVAHGRGDARVLALDGVTLLVEPSERLAVRGRSGSGKTTLLHVMGGLVAPSAGSVAFEGRPLSTLDERARARARAGAIAYVFQNANLLPHFTAFENVAFAARVASGEGPALEPLELLALVGLESKADQLPGELSGGEAQRVAIARALAQRARLVLCDEPTGQLDSDTARRVLDLVDALQAELGFALVIATHDAGVAARMDRELQLVDGRVAS